MRFWIIGVFPESAETALSVGVVQKAKQRGLLTVESVRLGDFSDNQWERVDDRIYGGAPGMLLCSEPLRDAVTIVGSKINPKLNIWNKKERKQAGILLVSMSPGGKVFSQSVAKRSVKYKEIVFVCGRYEGMDARVEHLMDVRWSIGDYVLSGGELAAAVCIDVMARLIPGVLGNKDSLLEESSGGVIEPPQYTRPEAVELGGKICRVPKVLLSGDHKKIADWRSEKTKNRL